MRVRRAPIKNIVKCEYFENLGLLFRKSNYWHYHAYAAYNHYQASISNPNLSQEEKRVLADKLLLSALCIPPVTL